MALAAAFAACTVLAACSSDGSRNQPLPAGAANPQLVLPDIGGKDDPYILMAFSGGGSRAAALSYSVLHQLENLKYASAAGQASLASRVKVISSVSGGSVTAAWFGVATPQEFDTFPARFLEPANMNSLTTKFLNPLTWMHLLSPTYDRTDVVRGMFEERLFGERSFADLNRPGHPLILLNTTDMASGEVFSFTPQRFDDICSNLRALPLSLGVAASSAVPLVETPVNLKNYSGDCHGRIDQGQWIHKEIEKPDAKYVNLEEYRRAVYAQSLRHWPHAIRQIDFLHLLDGGLADNQGIHSLMETITSPHAQAGILPAINMGELRRLVIIVVNARSEKDSDLNRQSSTPGLLSMAGAVAGIPIDAETSSVNIGLRNLVEELNIAAREPVCKLPPSTPNQPLFCGLRVYSVEIDFDLLEDQELRNRVKNIDTSWNLSSAELKDIDDAGAKLLRRNPCFQRLAEDLKINGITVDAAFAHKACRAVGANAS